MRAQHVYAASQEPVELFARDPVNPAHVAETNACVEEAAGELLAVDTPSPIGSILGNREVVEPALEKGAVDLYPGHAATELEFVNGGKGEASSDVSATMSKLNSYLSSRGVRALQPSLAVNTNGFAVTRATADRFHLKRTLVPINPGRLLRTQLETLQVGSNICTIGLVPELRSPKRSLRTSPPLTAALARILDWRNGENE